ncbi:fasciclin-like arabinogalactan protein 7 [Prunus yedoensis var. nudiflora]|uniref:Fasciclin-like arabinogalactan protein 7 n=1 Tax=Prunus yedoensis var. nudiflora TaxID=2094558 RepID=A0A314ZHX0_PRUYE|nr:fasciclin-like arabinogalactan protein 7 [Prunus yedoensis var. nudiflora]
MELPVVFMLLLLCSSAAYAKTSKSPILSPTPAPAPAPEYVNLTELLTVAGPFHTFLNYLESTKVLETFQDQANKTEEGITIFVPTDSAFSSLKKPSLSNLTADQLKSLILFHALPHYYSLSDFKNLSQSSPIPTFAGGQYTLNFTDVSGTVHLSSGWTDTKVSSSVLSTDLLQFTKLTRFFFLRQSLALTYLQPQLLHRLPKLHLLQMLQQLMELMAYHLQDLHQENPLLTGL